MKAPTPYAGNSGGRKAIVITAAVLAALCAAFVGLGAYANGLDTIYPNVTMEGVSLSGMTVSQAPYFSAASTFSQIILWVRNGRTAS